jgi:hypothetical protein
LFIIGRSLGGAVGTYAAMIEPELFDGIILENTFTSIADMVDNLFYLVGYFKFLILRIGWDTKSLITTLKLPILIITGDQDEIVPAIQSKYLYDAAKNSYSRHLYVVEGGTHNDTWRVGADTYRDRLNKFMIDSISIMSKMRDFNSRTEEKNSVEKSNSKPSYNYNNQNSNNNQDDL